MERRAEGEGPGAHRGHLPGEKGQGGRLAQDQGGGEPHQPGLDPPPHLCVIELMRVVPACASSPDN
jgi:hypothetical protein